MRDVLVTGGAGFIGSAVARRLVARGERVTVVDDLSTGRRENVPAGAELILADIGADGFPALLDGRRFDAVCHLAAQSSGQVSGEQPVLDLRVNAQATLALTRWCLANGVRRFLYASSMAAYGDPARLPVAEDAPLAPLSYYGVSKVASEHYLRIAALEGLSATAFRMFSVYGPGQNLGNRKQGMVSIYLAYMLDGDEVPVTGSLDRFRDFVFIDDVVDAWIAALDRDATPSPVYNLAGGRRVSVRELLARLMATAGGGRRIAVRELPGSANDQFGMAADISLAARELDWRPRTGLDDGLTAMIDWARQAA